VDEFVAVQRKSPAVTASNGFCNLFRSMPNFGVSCRGASAPSRGHGTDPFLLLPGAHPVSHTLVKVGRAHYSLYACESKSISYFVAHASEGEGDALALQLFDKVQ